MFVAGCHSLRLAQSVLCCRPGAEGRGYQNWDDHHLTLIGGATWAMTACSAVLHGLARLLTNEPNADILPYSVGIAQYVLADTVYVALGASHPSEE